MTSNACHCNRILCGLAVLLFVVGAALPVAGIGQAERGATARGAFNTKLGTFTPQPWSALSGWPREAHAEALEVFRQTCRNLKRREAWRETCAAAQAAGTDPAAAREFFESQFVPHMVSPVEQGKEGLMTGYFEPVLDGSPVRKGPFVVPVHGVPPDLLQLDARRWQGAASDGKWRAAIAGDQVVPLRGAQDATAEPGFDVDPAVFESEPLDRRFRVRRDGNRIVPYWTRQQIEAGAAPATPVLAWVDDPQALYLMQVQGSGQIRMPGGRTIRLSYADQNGHPFRPRGIVPTAIRTRSVPGAGDPEPVVVTPISMRTLSLVAADPGARTAARRKDPQKAAAAEKAAADRAAAAERAAADRSALAEKAAADRAAAAEKATADRAAAAEKIAANRAAAAAAAERAAADKVAAAEKAAADKAEAADRAAAAQSATAAERAASRERFALEKAAALAKNAAPDTLAQPANPASRPVHDVEKLVDALLAQPSRQKAAGARPAAPDSASASGAGARDARTTANLSYLVAAREKDPSYVFFQSAAPGGSGPMGALGVPLTATRSIAVDPRSTPLGSPVFIEAEREDGDGPLRRLMIAQDTGGAIRGAVRADFFWGTGPQAGAQAVRTRDDLAMWVLLPKNFARPKSSGTRTRGLGAGPAAECVMPDSDYCLE